MKKSYYIENGKYFDTTTETIYYPKPYCELCGNRYRLTVHHKLEQQKVIRDLSSKKVRFPNMWTKEFVNENQKLYTVCLDCHSNIHSMSDDRFFEKYHRKRSEFIF